VDCFASLQVIPFCFCAAQEIGIGSASASPSAVLFRFHQNDVRPSARSLRTRDTFNCFSPCRAVPSVFLRPTMTVCRLGSWLLRNGFEGEWFTSERNPFPFFQCTGFMSGVSHSPLNCESFHLLLLYHGVDYRISNWSLLLRNRESRGRPLRVPPVYAVYCLQTLPEYQVWFQKPKENRFQR